MALAGIIIGWIVTGVAVLLGAALMVAIVSDNSSGTF
jgi:hypothetical protein